MEENNYPYKLKKELSEPIPFDKMGNLTESKLYYHFESLSKQGLIEPVEVIKEENRPDKQVFAITDKGRQKLPEKIYNLFEKSDKLSEFIVGLFFIRHVEKEKIIRILEKKVHLLKERSESLVSLYNQVVVAPELQSMVEITNEYLTDRIKAEIYSIEKLILHLKSN